MKRTLSLVLALVMMLSILAPAMANADKASEARAEELFNKIAIQLAPFDSIGVEEIKLFVTEDVLSAIIYDLFAKEIKKNEKLAVKLGDGTELKTRIDEAMTDENITILLTESKAGKPVKSIVILEKYMMSIEGLFGEKWENIIGKEFKDSVKTDLDKIEDIVEQTVKSEFTDIENHWAKNDIKAMAIQGFLNGYPDRTFRPNGKVTRAEFSKMIVAALKLESEVYDTGFSDVAMGQWHANYIATMVKNQLVAGYPDGTFNPNGNITRNEMAMILAKVLKLEVSSEEQSMLLANFNDMALIPEWSKAAVAEAAKAELMKGDTYNNFNGADTATRAEAATVIARLMKR